MTNQSKLCIELIFKLGYSQRFRHPRKGLSSLVPSCQDITKCLIQNIRAVSGINKKGHFYKKKFT